jgi:antirestriction protein ArdC
MKSARAEKGWGFNQPARPAARAEAVADQKERTTMDVYSLITERIIEKLEHGTVPWHKPWRSIGAPRNLVSKKNYRGINVRREVA